MSFLKSLKNKIIQFVSNLKSIYEEIVSPSKVDAKYLKIHHSESFSYAFIDISKEIFNDKLLSFYLNAIFSSVKEHLRNDNSVLINIITKVVLQDKLNIIYTRSITFKQLFTLSDFNLWESALKQNIDNILLEYNDSKANRIELRLDYIRDKIQK